VQPLRTKPITAAAILGAAIGGGAIANAATTSPSTASSSQSGAATQQSRRSYPAHGTAAHEALEKPVTGTNASKAKAAAVKAVAQNHARVQTVMRRRVRDYRPLMAKGGERGANDLWQDFFSPRIGCRLQHPVHGIDLGTLCQRATSGQS
jgi:hypothetical protein